MMDCLPVVGWSGVGTGAVLWCALVALGVLAAWLTFRSLDGEGAEPPDKGDLLEVLRRSEQLHRVTLENISDAVFITDDTGRLTFICPNVAVIFGYTFDEVARMGAIDRLLGARLVDLEQLHADGEITNIEHTITDRDGTPHVLLVNIKRVDIQGGTVLYSCRDITRRKRSQQEALAYQDRLRRLALEQTMVEERQRRRIAAGLHDRIGQTLVALKIDAGRLRDGLDDPTRRELAETIFRRVDETIRDTWQLTFELCPPMLYDVGLVAALDWLVQRFAEQHSIDFVLRADQGEPGLPEDLRGMVFQATRELVLNAVKHARCSRVELHLERVGDELYLSVSDDGCGFDATRPGGSAGVGGFGLFSVRQRLELLGGRLDIDSAPGQGSRLTLVVPGAGCDTAGGDV